MNRPKISTLSHHAELSTLLQSGGSIAFYSNAHGQDSSTTIAIDLNRVLRERLRQAHVSFNAALALSTAGVVIVLVGVVNIYVGNIPEGAVTTAAGAISGLISAPLFKIHKDANDRLDEITKLTGELERQSIAQSDRDK